MTLQYCDTIWDLPAFHNKHSAPPQPVRQLIRHGCHWLKKKTTYSATNKPCNLVPHPLLMYCCSKNALGGVTLGMSVCLNLCSDSLPSAILARQLVLPEQNFPRTQALRVKWGNGVEVASMTGGWTMCLRRRITCPRMLLLPGADSAFPASSGQAHSPTMFWQT